MTSIIVDAEYLYTPLTSGEHEPSLNKPNTIYCKSPIWPIDDNLASDPVKLDVSVNGQKFSGGLDYTFLRKLILHRDVPMAGILNGNTKTLLIGQGFRSLKSKREFNAKWGPIQTDLMAKAEVADYFYTKEGYEGTIPGSEEIIAYWQEAVMFPRVDTKMDSSRQYTSVYKNSPKIINAKPLGGA